MSNDVAIAPDNREICVFIFQSSLIFEELMKHLYESAPTTVDARYANLSPFPNESDSRRPRPWADGLGSIDVPNPWTHAMRRLMTNTSCSAAALRTTRIGDIHRHPLSNSAARLSLLLTSSTASYSNATHLVDVKKITLS
ncbi:MAG: hypothetical protein WAZ48_07610 [Lysobacteraceae bacterium]